jgi:hypothetical protein
VSEERVLYEWVGWRGPENRLDGILRYAVEVGTLREVRLRPEWVCVIQHPFAQPVGCSRERPHPPFEFTLSRCGEMLVEVPNEC